MFIKGFIILLSDPLIIGRATLHIHIDMGVGIRKIRSFLLNFYDVIIEKIKYL